MPRIKWKKQGDNQMEAMNADPSFEKIVEFFKEKGKAESVQLFSIPGYDKIEDQNMYDQVTSKKSPKIVVKYIGQNILEISLSSIRQSLDQNQSLNSMLSSEQKKNLGLQEEKKSTLDNRQERSHNFDFSSDSKSKHCKQMMGQDNGAFGNGKKASEIEQERNYSMYEEVERGQQNFQTLNNRRKVQKSEIKSLESSSIPHSNGFNKSKKVYSSQQMEEVRCSSCFQQFGPENRNIFISFQPTQEILLCQKCMDSKDCDLTLCISFKKYVCMLAGKKVRSFVLVTSEGVADPFGQFHSREINEGRVESLKGVEVKLERLKKENEEIGERIFDKLKEYYHVDKGLIERELQKCEIYDSQKREESVYKKVKDHYYHSR